MGRLLQQVMKKPLAERILFGDLQGGGTVLADVKDDRIELRLLGAPA
jgi:ATP-dependent Clp protease ATP-binding subunit ClpA